MNGSPTHPACKHERGTTAVEICVGIPQEAGVTILVRAVASPPPTVADRIADEGEAAARVLWRRRTGGTPVVHAFAANACVDVPLCGSCLGAGNFEELLPPPADLGPYRRCRKCVAAARRRG
jgi:hypothetical protein